MLLQRLLSLPFQLQGGVLILCIPLLMLQGAAGEQPYKIVIRAETTGVKLRVAHQSTICMQILLHLRLLCVRFSFSSCSLIKDANRLVKARLECEQATRCMIKQVHVAAQLTEDHFDQRYKMLFG